MAAYWEDQDMVSKYRDLAEKTRNTTGTTRDKEQASFNTNVAGAYDDQQQKWNQQLANAYEDLANRYEYNQGKDWLNSMDLLTPYMNIEQLQKQIGQGLEGRGTKVDAATTQADQALQAQQQASQATAQANKTANINAGINKSRAGMLGSQAASADTSVAQNQYQANRSTAASTQADYLEKMAQANALDQQAKNMNKAAGLATLSAGLQGAGSGAAMGAVISDENMKERATETFEPDRDFGKKGQHETWYTHPANDVWFKDGKAYRDTIQQSTGMTAADRDNPNNGYKSRWGRNDAYVRNLTKYTSDENMKEDPIDDNKLQEAIAEFKRLSEKLKQLKGER